MNEETEEERCPKRVAADLALGSELKLRGDGELVGQLGKASHGKRISYAPGLSELAELLAEHAELGRLSIRARLGIGVGLNLRQC